MTEETGRAILKELAEIRKLLEQRPTVVHQRVKPVRDKYLDYMADKKIREDMEREARWKKRIHPH